MKRRDFVKVGTTGLAALVVGSKMPWLMANPAYAAVPVTTVNFRITDAIKHMGTDQTLIDSAPGSGLPPIPLTGNNAQCYFWCYKDDHFASPDCPGPIIFTTTGTSVQFIVTNDLTEPHSLAIPALKFTTGAIAPGATVVKKFTPRAAGTYLYYDNLNAPVNRVMGLHGAFIVMPKAARAGHKFTPFTTPPKNIQALFDDLGTAAWWPGLSWQEADPATDTPAFRQYIWLLHQASPRLFEEVGLFSQANPGQLYPPAQFIQKFLHDPLDPNNPVGPDGHPANNVPQFFTISGQSGHFSHNNPYICPNSRVGEPCIIRILNAGLWLHSTHIHANHVFVLSHNNKFDVVPGFNDNPIWIDVYTANPLDTYEWLVPYMRPPDVPNNLGIGRDDLEVNLSVDPAPIPDYGTGGNPTPAGVTTWPPVQELDFHIPKVGERIANDQQGNPIDLSVHMSPLCFPMHDHSEPSQVSQGGNYNMGMISGLNFTGDRKGAGPGEAGVITFEMAPPEHGPNFNDGVVPPTVPFVAPSLP